MSNQRPELISGCCRAAVTMMCDVSIIPPKHWYVCGGCRLPCNVHQHECDGADCCEQRGPVSTGNYRIRMNKEIVWPPLPGAVSRDIPEDVVIGLKSRIDLLEARLTERNEMMERWLREGYGNEERLAFLETRRIELQQMCERRSRELIEANERIAYLERLVGRLYAEKQE